MALVRVDLWLCVALLALCGCGGKPDAEQPPAVPEKSPRAADSPPDTRPVIAAFGDSLTEGFGVDPSHSYPAVLQRELDRLGYGYRVLNLGVSGDTTTNGLARLDNALALKPDIVILEFGANDGLRGLPLAASRANLEKMIAAIQESGTRVLLAGMTLPPNYGPAYIRPFEAIYRDLAAKYNVPLIPFFLEGVAGTTRYMQRDGLHPNAEGYARVAANVLKFLVPELGARRRAG